MSDNIRKPLGYHDPSQQTTWIAEVINNKDDVAKTRFQCRMIGHEADTINIPDSDLQWYTPLTPDGVGGGSGYNPRYLPGDTVVCTRIGEERFIIGAYRKQDPEVYQKETDNRNPSAADGTASNKHRLPHTTDQNFGWQGKIPTEAIQSQPDAGGQRTEYTRRNIKHQRTSSKIKQGQSETKNQFGRNSTKSKAGIEKSIGRQVKFDGSTNPMTFIKNAINNNGSLVPSLLDAVENLRASVESGVNVDSIQGIGPNTFLELIKSLLESNKSERKQKQAEQATEDQKQANDGDTR
jgi:hypothetical protein